MKPIRIIIAGGRDFTDADLLAREVAAFIKLLEPVPKLTDLEVVSGTYDGADKLGEDWAKKWGIPIEPFHPDWKTHGKKAGPMRNSAMAYYATHCICFWNGIKENSGTYDMIRKAKSHGLHLKIVNYTK